MRDANAELIPAEWSRVRTGLRALFVAALVSFVPLVGVASVYYAVRGYNSLARGGPTTQTRRAASTLLWSVPVSVVVLAAGTIATLSHPDQQVLLVYAPLVGVQVVRLAAWVVLGRGLCVWSTSARFVAKWDRVIRMLLIGVPLGGALFAIDRLTDSAFLKLPVVAIGLGLSFELGFVSWATYRMFNADLIAVGAPSRRRR
jgi:hypothetical protein